MNNNCFYVWYEPSTKTSNGILILQCQNPLIKAQGSPTKINQVASILLNQGHNYQIGKNLKEKEKPIPEKIRKQLSFLDNL